MYVSGKKSTTNLQIKILQTIFPGHMNNKSMPRLR